MKRILLAGATLLALTAAQPTLAADAPVYKGPPPAAVALFNWTGFYLGADAGYLWSKSSLFLPGGITFLANADAKGWSLGGHVGYRYQFSSSFVVGLEGDIAWLGADGSGLYNNDPSVGGRLDFKSNASVRGMIGFAMDRSLIYFTGGGTWLRYDGCSHGAATPSVCVAGTTFGKTASGWTVGGGWAFAFTNALIGRIEYLFADYGAATFVTPPTNGGVTTVDIKTHTVRAGLSLKF